MEVIHPNNDSNLKDDIKNPKIVPFIIKKQIIIEKIIDEMKKNNYQTTEDYYEALKEAKVNGYYFLYSGQDGFCLDDSIFKIIKCNSDSINVELFKQSIKNNFETILPYDIKNAKDFNPAYLEGFPTYTIKQEVENDLLNSSDSQFYLVPVWIIQYYYMDESQPKYIILNGETGELSGTYHKYVKALPLEEAINAKIEKSGMKESIVSKREYLIIKAIKLLLGYITIVLTAVLIDAIAIKVFKKTSFYCTNTVLIISLFLLLLELRISMRKFLADILNHSYFGGLLDIFLIAFDDYNLFLKEKYGIDTYDISSDDIDHEEVLHLCIDNEREV